MIRNLTLIILGIFILLHIIILSKLVFFPYPEFFVYPYLTNQGLVPYKQIFDQHFPGLMFLPINLDNLGFHTPFDARAWQFGVVVITHLLIFVTSKKLFKSNKKALISNFLYIVWQPTLEGWVLWIDNFLPIFYLMSFYFLLRGETEQRRKFYLLAGIALGAATVFKQVVIPLFVILALYLFFQKKFKEFKLFILGFLPLPLLMVAYFVFQRTFSDFWYWTVTFNLTTFAEFGRKFAGSSEIIRAGFVLLPTLGLLFVKKAKEVLLLLIFIFGGLLAAYARFDFVHLQPALPFAVLAAVYVLGLFKHKFKLFFLITYCILAGVFLVNFYKGHLGSKVYFYDEETLLVSEKIKKLTNPEEKIFIYGSPPHLYQMTETLPAGDVFVFQFPWFIMESEDRLKDALMRDKPNVIVADRTVTIQGAKIIEYMSWFDGYISENYYEIDRVGTTQILLKRCKSQHFCAAKIHEDCY